MRGLCSHKYRRPATSFSSQHHSDPARRPAKHTSARCLKSVWMDGEGANQAERWDTLDGGKALCFSICAPFVRHGQPPTADFVLVDPKRANSCWPSGTSLVSRSHCQGAMLTAGCVKAMNDREVSAYKSSLGSKPPITPVPHHRHR